nr:ANTAR domain-containing protein [Allobranchiibius sp. GilTou38]
MREVLNTRVLIERAKDMLSAQHGMAISDAFTVMRGHARRSDRTLTQVAANIIEGATDFLHPTAKADQHAGHDTDGPG